jgi:hypothetical protein
MYYIQFELTLIYKVINKYYYSAKRTVSIINKIKIFFL